MKDTTKFGLAAAGIVIAYLLFFSGLIALAGFIILSLLRWFGLI